MAFWRILCAIFILTFSTLPVAGPVRSILVRAHTAAAVSSAPRLSRVAGLPACNDGRHEQVGGDMMDKARVDGRLALINYSSIGKKSMYVRMCIVRQGNRQDPIGLFQHEFSANVRRRRTSARLQGLSLTATVSNVPMNTLERLRCGKDVFSNFANATRQDTTRTF